MNTCNMRVSNAFCRVGACVVPCEPSETPEGGHSKSTVHYHLKNQELNR